MGGQDTVLGGRYRLVRPLEEGGMGAVFEAIHVGVDRPVAVKYLHEEIAGDPEARTRFELEAKAAGRIGHDNICEALDFGVDDEGRQFFVMPLLRGEPLCDTIARSAPLSTQRASDIACQILSALAAAHASGIIHRDLKPENVFLTTVGDRADFVKILDFGISRMASNVTVDEDGNRITKTGAILGTPYYMSPEQARAAKDVDGRIDVYSVGVILYEMLTGKLPFEARNANELLWKIWNDDPPPPTTYQPDLHPALEEVILTAVAKDPDERFADAETMRLALLDAAHEAMASRASLARAILRESMSTKKSGEPGLLRPGTLSDEPTDPEFSRSELERVLIDSVETEAVPEPEEGRGTTDDGSEPEKDTEPKARRRPKAETVPPLYGKAARSEGFATDGGSGDDGTGSIDVEPTERQMALLEQGEDAQTEEMPREPIGEPEGLYADATKPGVDGDDATSPSSTPAPVGGEPAEKSLRQPPKAGPAVRDTIEDPAALYSDGTDPQVALDPTEPHISQELSPYTPEAASKMLRDVVDEPAEMEPTEPRISQELVPVDPGAGAGLFSDSTDSSVEKEPTTPRAPWIGTGEMVVATPTPRSPRRRRADPNRRRVIVLAGTGSFLGAAITLAFLAVPRQSAPDESGADPLAAQTAPGPEPVLAALPADAGEEASAEGGGNAGDREHAAAREGTGTITLLSLPRQARITVNGVSVDGPDIQIPEGRRGAQVTVTAPGRQEWTRWVVRDGPEAVRVTMPREEIAAPARPESGPSPDRDRTRDEGAARAGSRRRARAGVESFGQVP